MHHLVSELPDPFQFWTARVCGPLLQQAGVRVSMNGRGRAPDNCFVERLWRSVKYEEVCLHDYASPREARRQLAGYFDFYNLARPHQSPGYRAPAQVYRGSIGAAPHGGRKQAPPGPIPHVPDRPKTASNQPTLLSGQWGPPQSAGQ